MGASGKVSVSPGQGERLVLILRKPGKKVFQEGGALGIQSLVCSQVRSNTTSMDGRWTSKGQKERGVRGWSGIRSYRDIKVLVGSSKTILKVIRMNQRVLMM